ncbi:RibD family protein [uncultured Ruegeria sp.]|uniref:RibD family protein n=1 Tax=uncultured Ruegeria sp. TaxID=259304 RepID=UPI00260FF795|nr:RibD family protein [uncultured Ruegeria sp.]
MRKVDVTDRVWSRVLSQKTSAVPCSQEDNWSDGETQALALYGPLAQPANETLVFAQIGQSLDGRIATESGDAQNISGPDGLAHLHRLRALADVVVIGVKTALHDDPQLTVRLAEGQSPARVVIDPAGRLRNSARLLQDDTARRIVVQAVDKERPDGVETVTLPRADWISAHEMVNALEDLGFKRILIEGGGVTIAQFLEAGLLNRLHVAVAPLLIGAGPQSLKTSAVETLADALRPATDFYDLGSDVLFDCEINTCAAV